jgi:hypothetical protein
LSANLTIHLNRPQSRAFRAIKPNSTTCLPWGRGVGKSWFERFAIYSAIARGKTRAVLMLPTFKQAVDVHGRALEHELASQWAFLGGRLNRTTWRVDFANGSWLQFFGAENAHAARGIRCDLVVVDEADDVDPSVYDSVIQPWFSEPWSQSIKVLGGTPRRGRYGLLWRTHRRGVIDAPEHLADHVSVHATAYDAPETVSRAAVERARAETPPAVFKREWLCDFDSGEALVYDIFDESFHVREPHPNMVWSQVLVGVDWGYSDPGVFLLLGVAGSGRDATVHVLHEVYATGKQPDYWIEQARTIRTWYPDARWYADPSRPDMIAALDKRAGVRIEGADNAIDDGVATVVNHLARRTREDGTEYARLYVSRSCRELIRELGLYRRKRDRRDNDRVLDDYEQGNDHGPDALRYALHSRFKADRSSGRNDASAERRTR